VLVATGTPGRPRLRGGEDLAGVIPSLAFLRTSKLGEAGDLKTKRVVVIGGGNVAMDAARSARRLAPLRCNRFASSNAKRCRLQLEIDEALEEAS